MPRNILESISPELAEGVEGATDEQKRALCVLACRLALKHTNLDAPLVENAMRSLEKGVVNNEQITQALEQLVGDLDDSYFAAEKRYLAGAGDQETYIALARKARAADAVLVSFNEDAFIAATYCIYETCAALGSADEVQAIVHDVLARKP